MDTFTSDMLNSLDNVDDGYSELITRISISLASAIKSDPEAWLALFQSLEATKYGSHPSTAEVESDAGADVVVVDDDDDARLGSELLSPTMLASQCDGLADPYIESQLNNTNVQSTISMNPNSRSNEIQNMHPCKECMRNRTKVCPTQSSITFLLHRTSFLHFPYFYLPPQY